MLNEAWLIEHRLTYEINKRLGRSPKDMSSAQDRPVICAICIDKSPTLDIKVTSFTLYIYIYIYV